MLRVQWAQHDMILAQYPLTVLYLKISKLIFYELQKRQFTHFWPTQAISQLLSTSTVHLVTKDHIRNCYFGNWKPFHVTFTPCVHCLFGHKAIFTVPIQNITSENSKLPVISSFHWFAPFIIITILHSAQTFIDIYRVIWKSVAKHLRCVVIGTDNDPLLQIYCWLC